MLLLLIRHARAEERDAARWPDDALRPLTDAGRKIQRRTSRTLAELGIEPEAVLSSPWVRAWETAELLIDAMTSVAPPIACPPLAAEPDLAALQEHVGTHAGDSTVALVGHSPFLEELASLLLAGSTSAIAIDFPKSGVLGLELERLDAGQATLGFLLRPKQLKRG